MTRQNIFLLLAACCMLLLSACGFHPRGDVELPKAMSKTYIQGATPYSDLETDLRRSLSGSTPYFVRAAVSRSRMSTSSLRTLISSRAA
jgi:outer membrane lipopolysaccharide assembly protein LptE/RlpB